MKFSIRKRLNIGFAAAILLVLAVGPISFATFQKQYQEQELVKHTYRVRNQLEAIKLVLVDMETGRRGFRSANDKKFLLPFKIGLQKTASLLSELQELVKDNPQQLKRSEALKNSVDDILDFWNSLGEGTSKFTRTSGEISEITSVEKDKMDHLRSQLAEMLNVENQLLMSRENESNRTIRLSKWGLVIGILFILCIVIVLIIQIVKEFKNRQKAEDDLQKNYKELSVAGEENSKRNWLLDGLAKVNDVLQNHFEMDSLSKVVLDTVVKYVDVEAGAFYVYDEEQKKIRLAASYALPNTARKEYALNEGFVGQAAAEKDPLIISDIPSKYATIDGGTITLEPVHAVYASFCHTGQLKGIIELLSFKPLPAQSVEFLRLITNNISVAVHAVKEREKVQQLLEQVQRQKEVLEHQQEELRQTNEELTVQAEVLQASEEELRVQEEELRQINSELKEKNAAIENTRQSLMIKAKELEESSKYKSEFLANMSHELRTPLNSVLILAKLLSENKDHNLTEKQVAHAKIIYRSGSDLLRLINDILDLSKIEAGKVNLNIENVSVKSIATDLEQLFAVVAEEKGIKYIVEILDGVPEKIKTDRQKVEQVLKNLLSNAFKFTAKNGQVKLQFKHLNHGVEQLAIVVQDTGIGIPKAKQQVIFEAFQQADGSTNRKYGGTGLGLSITKELMRILKGKVHVESKEDEGSTFTIFIPVDQDTIEPHSSIDTASIIVHEPDKVVGQTEVPDERASLTKEDRAMLIIEDDKSFAVLIKEFAISNGFKPIVALSGDEGLYCAKKYLPSAIILDMNLPGIDGRTLLKLFKEDDHLKHIPVHVISAEDDASSLPAGALAFLKKPVEKKQLDNAFSMLGEYLNASVKRVLIFSKNNLKGEICKTLTEDNNYGVVCDGATSLNEGIEKLDKTKYDCIIADFGANITEGISNLSALNKHLLPRRIPTIIYLDSDISTTDELEMKRVADVVVRKSSFSNKRLLDELELFLYKVQEKAIHRQGQLKKPVELDAILENKKVLLVDDDMRNIFALSAALENQRMEVITASDGKEALNVLKDDKNIDIVLMDLMMPEMDGYEAIQIIRQEMKLTHLPVIALTAKAMTGDQEKCLAAGASDYISKPVDVHKLASLMRVWLS